ncbi:hypothetical protein N866_07355 [Actinotalea ferrariae CF5-4]|uniref:Uncharacterized protein n=1 Tax=Actinotalea ferrariae CF5-4 TaxID=948458 RepID=A0A021VU33_9CELL|nr:hypothetical protein [Actinotalea ferrariae]EYR62582.1 hypothetical protein N866_07355 [Actinotalea ferrariae CF5-4]
MDDQPQRATHAAQVPMNSGPGMSASFGVAAPVGAVSRKDRERANRTALRREGQGLLLRTALPGTVLLQRQDADGWETVTRRAASRLGRTRLALPDDAAAATYRVMFSPKNGNIPSWVSPVVDA